jgi:hypothetical protein
MVLKASSGRKKNNSHFLDVLVSLSFWNRSSRLLFAFRLTTTLCFLETVCRSQEIKRIILFSVSIPKLEARCRNVSKFCCVRVSHCPKRPFFRSWVMLQASHGTLISYGDVTSHTVISTIIRPSAMEKKMVYPPLRQPSPTVGVK